MVIERVAGDIDFALDMPKVRNVLGIAGFCPCVKTHNQDIAHLQETAVAYMRQHYGDRPLTFKVETTRADKRYPIPSQQVSALVGGAIFTALDNATVDLHNPDVELWIELRTDAYIYGKVVPGPGGLPAGSSGKGVLMLSGGIDSPVAGFMMAKRGVALDAVYFHAPPFTSPRAEEKVHDLAKQLATFTGFIRLHIVYFTPTQTYLYENVPHDKLTIFLKRAMFRIAEKIAEKQGCMAIITGDALAQVASQTMHGIHASHSAAKLPVLRPLIGFDKIDVIRLAQQIGTYDISIRPYEDCCTVFVAKHPEIKPKASVVERIEQKKLTALEPLLAEAAETAVAHEF